VAYKIAQLADTHLGYSARCRAHSSGLNTRVLDGYLGLRETVDQILAADVDLVLHGGDVFHRSQPSVNDIAWARRQLERLAAAGIPVIGTTGNHDFSNDRGKAPATAAIHDHDRHIDMVIEPYQMFRPTEGLNVHLISHVGLLAAQRVIPEPVDGEVNVFVTHGAAQVPGHEIFATVDSPGEAVIGFDVLSLPWTVSLLGHYHGMGALPGFDAGRTGQAWYAGSLLRRGFSDPAGGRGWLLVTVGDDGAVSVEPQYIRQRPQFDLPVIDAAGMSGAQVEELIRAHLNATDLSEAIVRQRVTNCALPVRRGVDTAALGELAKDALVWQPEFTRPLDVDFADLPDEDAAAGSLSTAAAADLPTMFTGWFGDWAERTQVASDLRPQVVALSTKLLRQVSGEAETGASEALTSVAAHTEAEDPFALSDPTPDPTPLRAVVGAPSTPSTPATPEEETPF
jgi:DNA repair protein SbcD/Mre11